MPKKKKTRYMIVCGNCACVNSVSEFKGFVYCKECKEKMYRKTTEEILEPVGESRIISIRNY